MMTFERLEVVEAVSCVAFAEVGLPFSGPGAGAVPAWIAVDVDRVLDRHNPWARPFPRGRG
ncbi:hypothetical protein ACFQZZ_01085 [Nocardia sp. GCM10030253]|uniref:hypothetical protein n=1 Tax=Nocardia sp. GCM10030253 TaxID=3273404 RepID=UPI0036434099